MEHDIYCFNATVNAQLVTNRIKTVVNSVLTKLCFICDFLAAQVVHAPYSSLLNL